MQNKLGFSVRNVRKIVLSHDLLRVPFVDLLIGNVSSWIVEKYLLLVNTMLNSTLRILVLEVKDERKKKKSTALDGFCVFIPVGENECVPSLNM